MLTDRDSTWFIELPGAMLYRLFNFVQFSLVLRCVILSRSEALDNMHGVTIKIKKKMENIKIIIL